MGLFTYYRDDKGKLKIYSTNPINEIDLLRAALCLVDHSNRTVMGDWLSKHDKNYLQFMQVHHPSFTYDDKLTNDDLIKFINILNEFYDHMVKEDRECELMTMTLTQCPHRYFGVGYGHPFRANTIYPFRMILTNRFDTVHTKERSLISSECSFDNVTRFKPYPVATYSPSKSHLPLIAATAILMLGVAALLLVRVCTGEIGAFFALGAFKSLDRTISGLPHAGVGLVALAAYAGVRLNAPGPEQVPVIKCPEKNIV